MTDDGLNEENAHIPLENDDLQVCTSMSPSIVGELVELYRNKAIVRFRPNERMIMDECNILMPVTG